MVALASMVRDSLADMGSMGQVSMVVMASMVRGSLVDMGSMGLARMVVMGGRVDLPTASMADL